MPFTEHTRRAVDVARSTASRYDDHARVKLRLASPKVKAILNAKHRVDDSYDIPYVAGISRDLKTLYRDRRFKTADYDDLLWLHECGEAIFILYFGDRYDTAHRLITIAERDEVERRGGNWKAYKAMFESLAMRLRHEPLTRVPENLFLRPYEDSQDHELLRRMRQVMR